MLANAVKARSTTTRPMTALRCIPEAPAKKFTTAEPRVVPLASNERGRVTPPPITNDTAMASPRARPVARVTAA